MGSLAYDGNRYTKNAIQFIIKYFPDVYKNYADLIYIMWRHGLVHEYAPKRLYIDNERASKIKISWRSDNNTSQGNRKYHIKIFYRDSDKDLYLSVNICQLVDDLLVALRSFIADLKNNPTYAEECDKRLDKTRSIRSINELRVSPTNYNKCVFTD